MRLIHLSGFFILMLISSFSLSQTNTVSIRLNSATGEDAVIGDLLPNTVAPNHPDVVAIAWTVQGIPSNARSLFKFNLSSIPITAIVTDARLSLFGNTCNLNPLNEGDNKAYLRRIVSPWSANTVTWNNQPAYDTTGQIFYRQSQFPRQDYTGYNVTNLVQQMVQNPNTNYGFYILLNTEIHYRSLNFASSECSDTSKRPLLVITYTITTGFNSTSNEIPKEYRIYQNYPNPFNPNTIIKFDIPKNSFVRMSVLNLLGKEIEFLVNENLSAGSYSVPWNGSSYPSGIYYYKIESEAFRESKKMILLK